MDYLGIIILHKGREQVVLKHNDIVQSSIPLTEVYSDECKSEKVNQFMSREFDLVEGNDYLMSHISDFELFNGDSISYICCMLKENTRLLPRYEYDVISSMFIDNIPNGWIIQYAENKLNNPKIKRIKFT